MIYKMIDLLLHSSEYLVNLREPDMGKLIFYQEFFKIWFQYWPGKLNNVGFRKDYLTVFFNRFQIYSFFQEIDVRSPTVVFTYF